MMMPALAGARPPLSLAEFASELIGHYAATGCRPRTVNHARCVLDEFVEVAGVRSIDDLSEGALRRFIEHQSGRQSSHTFNSKLNVLQSLFNHAARIGLIVSPPPFPPIPQVRQRIASRLPDPGPSREEVVRLLAHLRNRTESWEDHRLYALVATIVFTGILRDEALFLRVDDCDLVEGTIRIRRREAYYSTSFRPAVRIPTSLLPILEHWLPLAGPEWVFPTKSRSGPWTGGGPGKKPLQRLQTIAGGLGIEGMTFESLRRFFHDNAESRVDLDVETRPFPAVLRVTADHRPPSGKTRPVLERPEAKATAPHVLVVPAARRTKTKDITLPDATRLMAHLLRNSQTWEGHRLYAVVAVALYMGLRWGSVRKIRVENVDLQSREMRFPGRAIPLVIPAAAARVLTEWIPRNGGSPWVFPGTKLVGPWIGGRPGEQPLDKLARAGRECGIDAITFEALRSLWRRHAGQIELGEEYHSLQAPERSAEGPRPRPPGPKPLRPRERIARDLGRGDRSAEVESNDGVRAPVAPVVLGADHKTAPVVMGRLKERLSRAGYQVIRTLIEAGPQGLSEAEMVTRSGCGDARGILRRLVSKDLNWKSIIQMPGRDRRGRYRIARSE